MWSTLDPLFFIMYVNDLPKCSSFSTKLYADDTYLCLAHTNLKQLKLMVNNELIKVDEWMHLNKVSINYAKSMYFLTGKLFNKAEEEKRNFKIHINNVVLHQKTSVKYLDVLLDESLNWTSHVKSLKSKLSFASSMIYKIRNFVPINALRIICFCFVYSHLQYCIVSCGTVCDSVLKPLNTIHNNVLRALIFTNFKCLITPLYKQLGFLKIKDIYQLELSKLMYKFHNNTLPQSYNSFFQKITETHCHFTRSVANQNYFVPRVGSSLGKRNLTYQGAVAWSSIPQEFKNFSCGRFAKTYKKFLITLCNT